MQQMKHFSNHPDFQIPHSPMYAYPEAPPHQPAAPTELQQAPAAEPQPAVEPNKNLVIRFKHNKSTDYKVSMRQAFHDAYLYGRHEARVQYEGEEQIWSVEVGLRREWSPIIELKTGWKEFVRASPFVKGLNYKGIFDAQNDVILFQEDV
ncbi:uncharacterized protein LOC131012601 [Salvia miltiorrhiza]|uniref:uncharacterized protein LOC131012601 n=1 Tax=Salvia miltiorrhiza TaxID=226208 RepID=UPI0025ABEEB6|nr:uncharacterized protein LOC131012601 [Salvia miltiorrhiza]